MSERSQKIAIWWGVVFAVIYGLALIFLLRMVPPPSAHQTAAEVAHRYLVHSTGIRIGAVIASWCSAFMLPIACVVGIQMWRQERGGKIWSVLTISGGSMMSVFLVLPPLFWGVAAFDPHRAAQATDLMHELGMLTLVTTDQFYIFMWVAIVVMCFIPTTVTHSPFQRWYGYYTAWTTVMFEVGAIAFMAHSGPFAWNGLLVYWFPLSLFGLWIAVTAYVFLHSLTLQMAEASTANEPVPVAPAPSAASAAPVAG